MIVKWAEDRIKVIPKADGLGSVILAPGYNEIADANWAHARPRVMNQIAEGKIVEEWTKISPEQVKDFAVTIEEGKTNFAPAELKDINRPRVIEVVKQTYHVPTLEAWMEKELRQDVRIAIMRQLTEVDRGNVDDRKAALAQILDRVK